MNGASFAFEHDATEIDLAVRWWGYPPRYKREPRLPERRQAMREVASIRSFADAVRSVAGANGPKMQLLADEYGALLGLVAGIAAADASPWSWLAAMSAGAGSILMIADGEFHRRFAKGPSARASRPDSHGSERPDLPSLPRRDSSLTPIITPCPEQEIRRLERNPRLR